MEPELELVLTSSLSVTSASILLRLVLLASAPPPVALNVPPPASVALTLVAIARVSRTAWSFAMTVMSSAETDDRSIVDFTSLSMSLRAIDRPTATPPVPPADTMAPTEAPSADAVIVDASLAMTLVDRLVVRLVSATVASIVLLM